MSQINVKKNRSKAKLDYSKPIIVVNRSNKYTVAQLLLENGSKTVFTVNSSTLKEGTKEEKALEVGKLVAEKLKEQKIESVIFNRNGYIYHGRIKAVADGIRSGGIKI